MRLFVAFALDDPARDALCAVARDLAGRLARSREPRAVRWVERENLHVTLRFLGEVDEAQVTRLTAALAAPVPVEPFEMELGGGGCFPGAGPPRVAWVGVTGGVEEARAVFSQLDERLAPLGFAREARGYTPHVTLGRVRELGRRAGRDLRAWLESTHAPLATMNVRDAVLYRSHLTPAGSRYECMCRIGLGSS
jgi:2'-5' RNA ligase